jgi:hypothetical protein
VEQRTERVVVETVRYRVMTLPREGHRSRVEGSGRDWNAPVLMLARRHIRLIVAASEGA